MDPSLGLGDGSVFPSLAGIGGLGSGVEPGGRSSVVITEGMPPIASKLLDKIRRWEYTDLALLLHVGESSQKIDEVPSLPDGRVVIFQSWEQAQRRRKQIGDTHSWSQAFTVYMAALASANSTGKEEVVGLIAYAHLILQLSKETGGLRWLKYDQQFREWAAAKGVKIWGELNLTIYGRCLAMQLPPAPQPAVTPPYPEKPRRGDKRGRLSRGAPKKGGTSGSCFKWNFEGTCERGGDCHYTHTCYNCGEGHQVADCPRAPKRPRGDVP